LKNHIDSNCKVKKFSRNGNSSKKVKKEEIDNSCNQLILSFETLTRHDCDLYESFIHSFSINGKIIVDCTINELKDYLRGNKGAKISTKKKEDLLVRIYKVASVHKEDGELK
jgi:hypothetical protein